MNDLAITHDGSHIIDFNRCFEWWYFDFDLQDGQSVYLEWHAPVFNSRGRYCILVARFRHVCETKDQPHVTDNSITKVYRYERSRVIQQERFCHIQFPGGIIREEDGDYFINLSEKDLSLKLRLRRRFLSVRGREEMLYHVDSSDEYFSWCVPFPRGSVEGRMNLDGNIVDVAGESYHDHNWGSLHIAKHLDGWIWARLFFRKFVLIFGVILSKDKRIENILYLLDEFGNQIRTKSLSIEYRGQAGHVETKPEIPKEITISFVDNVRYTIHLESLANLTSQEFPLGSFNSHRLNALLAASYYALKLDYLPAFLKKALGRGFYSQFLTKADLYIDDQPRDRGKGKMEIFSFGI